MGPRQQQLWQAYVTELRAATAQVNPWWKALAMKAIQEGGTQVAAAMLLRRRWPVGPAAHPRILAVIRAYYLACHQLNQVLPVPEGVTDFRLDDTVEDEQPSEPDLPINPLIFVRDSLLTEATPDLARIATALTYWPIGMNEAGEYV